MHKKLIIDNQDINIVKIYQRKNKKRPAKTSSKSKQNQLAGDIAGEDKATGTKLIQFQAFCLSV